MNFKTKTAAAGILAVLTVAAAAFVILPRHKKLPAPAAVQADKVLVKKAERKLYLQKDGQNLKEYRPRLCAGRRQAAGGRRQNAGRHIPHFRPQSEQPFLPVAPGFLPQCGRPAGGGGKRLFPGRRHYDSRTAEQSPVFGQRPSSARLDGRLHRRYQRGNRRDMVNGCRRHDN